MNKSQSFTQAIQYSPAYKPHQQFTAISMACSQGAKPGTSLHSVHIKLVISNKTLLKNGPTKTKKKKVTTKEEQILCLFLLTYQKGFLILQSPLHQCIHIKYQLNHQAHELPKEFLQHLGGPWGYISIEIWRVGVFLHTEARLAVPPIPL